MLFNLGFTADAAAAHRHEFSVPEGEQPSSPSFLSLNSPISLPSIPAITLGCPFTSPTSPGQLTMPDNKNSSFSAISSNVNTPYVSSDDQSADEAGTLIAEPQRPRKRLARSKTTFQLAHPPSNLRQRKLRLLPKLLLQLQQIGQMSRPVPAFDVLPATIAPRLAGKFPKLFGAIHGLGPRDLVVVTSDMYERYAGDDDRSVSSEEVGQEKEVVATICQPRRDEAMRKRQMEIYLSSGMSWEATPLANGSYEFVSEGGLRSRKVRWVLRGKENRRASGVWNSVEVSKRFTFSEIDPNTRRHPVVASLASSSIDVYEQYSLPPESREEMMSKDGSVGELGPELIQMDDELRMLIVVTGIYVAFIEGWVKNYSYGDPVSLGDSPIDKAPVSPGKRKSFSVPSREKEAPGKALFPAVESSVCFRRSVSVNRSQTFPTRTSEALADTTPTPSPSEDVIDKKHKQRSASSQSEGVDRSNRRSRASRDTRDLRWTDLQGMDNQTSKKAHETTRKGLDAADSPHTSERDAEEESKSKSKRWHRLSAIFGKKKH